MKTASYVAAFACAVTLLGAAAHPKSGPTAKSIDVRISTSLGPIVVRLDPKRAPKTTANFLHYVDSKAYDGTSFYRTVARENEPQAPFEVIQGGIGPSGASGSVPIVLEPTSKSGLHNTDGAIAMARSSDPDSATTEFFIDVGDARYLDAGGPLGPGYAVFGRVIAGQALVRKIHAAHAQGESLQPPVRIVSMRRSRGQ